MFRKAYTTQITVFIIFLILFSVICPLFSVNCYAQADKVSKLMPSRTELLSQKEDKSQLVLITSYKFASTNSKEKILEFYRKLFTNEGFSELEGYSPERKIGGPQMAYFFAKENRLAILNVLLEPENGLIIYYVTLHEPDVEGIKNFNSQEKQYEKE